MEVRGDANESGDARYNVYARNDPSCRAEQAANMSIVKQRSTIRRPLLSRTLVTLYGGFPLKGEIVYTAVFCCLRQRIWIGSMFPMEANRAGAYFLSPLFRI
jgi:hypothetical protein